MASKVLEYGLIGVGGFLLYEYLTNPNFFSGLFGSTPTPVPTGTNAASSTTYGSAGSAMRIKDSLI